MPQRITPSSPFTSASNPKAETGPRLAAEARGLGYGLAVVDRALRPVAAAIDAVRLGSAFSQDGDRIGPHTAHTAGGIAGGWLGGWVGDSAGAGAGELLGASIGAIGGGPVGAVAGAAIGGALGGLGGAIGGSMIGSKIGERFADHAIGADSLNGVIS